MLEKQAKAKRAAQERAAAQARAALEAKLLKQAQSDEARLAAADVARDADQILLASKIYLRLGLSRSDSKDDAKSRLEELKDDGRARLAKIGDRVGSTSTTVEILEAFSELESLERQFSKVPKVNTEIRMHIAKQRRRPQIVAALNEPQAAGLYDLAQKHEKAGQVCCAFIVYEEAAKLAPATSGVQAKKRLEELKKDSAAVAAASQCRELAWCHKTYEAAERLAKVKPDRAKKMFVQITEKAPFDSEIFRAARYQLAQLGS